MPTKPGNNAGVGILPAPTPLLLLAPLTTPLMIPLMPIMSEVPATFPEPMLLDLLLS